MWFYNNKELKNEDVPAKAVGFVYLIENKFTGKQYIGRKLLTKAGYKTVKGVKKKIRKANDWQNYWSSSPELLADIEKLGVDSFKRTVLVFCNGLLALNYTEEKFLYGFGVLETPDAFYNSNIRVKMFKKNVLNHVPIDELQSILKQLSH